MRYGDQMTNPESPIRPAARCALFHQAQNSLRAPDIETGAQGWPPFLISAAVLDPPVDQALSSPFTHQPWLHRSTVMASLDLIPDEGIQAK